MQPSITFGKVETDDGDFKHVELRQRLKRYKAAVIILVTLLLGCMSTIAWLVFTSHYVCASDSEGNEANPDNNRVSLCLRKHVRQSVNFPIRFYQPANKACSLIYMYIYLQ